MLHIAYLNNKDYNPTNLYLEQSINYDWAHELSEFNELKLTELMDFDINSAKIGI